MERVDEASLKFVEGPPPEGVSKEFEDLMDEVTEMRTGFKRTSWQGRTIRTTRVRAAPAMSSPMVVDLPEDSIVRCSDEAMCPKQCYEILFSRSFLIFSSVSGVLQVGIIPRRDKKKIFDFLVFGFSEFFSVNFFSK